MFGSNLLDVAIGTIFTFLLLSLICSAASEILERFLKNRATDLERGLRELLLDPNNNAKDSIIASVYQHPLINGLFKGKYENFAASTRTFTIFGRTWQVPKWLLSLFRNQNLPSYIPARSFALALMDVVAPGTSATPASGDAPAAVDELSGAAGATAPPAAAAPLVVVGAAAASGAPGPNPLQPLRDKLGALPNPQTRQALITLVDAAGNDVNKARENIETWFNSSMDRVSGWYKRRAQLVIFILGLGVAVVLNADAVSLVKALSADKALRDSLVAKAQTIANANTGAQSTNPAPSSDKTLPPACQKDENSAECKLAKTQLEIKELGLPFGWDSKDDPWRAWPGKGLWCQLGHHWLGWLITALAVSLGAPFWFDLLNKFIVVRSTVKPHEKSQEEAAK